MKKYCFLLLMVPLFISAITRNKTTFENNTNLVVQVSAQLNIKKEPISVILYPQQSHSEPTDLLSLIRITLYDINNQTNRVDAHLPYRPGNRSIIITQNQTGKLQFIDSGE